MLIAIKMNYYAECRGWKVFSFRRYCPVTQTHNPEQLRNLDHYSDPTVTYLRMFILYTH